MFPLSISISKSRRACGLKNQFPSKTLFTPKARHADDRDFQVAPPCGCVMQASFLLFSSLPLLTTDSPWMEPPLAVRSGAGSVVRGRGRGRVKSGTRAASVFLFSLSRQSVFCAGGGDCSAREDRRAAPRESFTVLVHRVQTALQVSAIIASASYKKTYLGRRRKRPPLCGKNKDTKQVGRVHRS